MRRPLDAGFTLVELLIVVAVIGVISAVAIPGLLRARMSGNEASAIASLRIINSSQQAYSSGCGNGFYAATLTVLGEAPSGGTAFISPDLGTSDTITKSGFSVTMEEGSEAQSATEDGCNASGTSDSLFTSYFASAGPTSPGHSGNRWFWTNLLGTVYEWNSDVFGGQTVGNAPPTAGSPIR